MFVKRICVFCVTLRPTRMSWKFQYNNIFPCLLGFGGQTTGTTTVKFNPPSGSDTMMMEHGQQTRINTWHQCITAMKEYENKSLEVKHTGLATKKTNEL